MSITVALACAAASLLTAILFDSWIRSRKGTGRENARIYAVVKGRISNFRSFQLIPVIIFVAVVCAAAGIGISWKKAAFCLAGAVAVLVPLIVGSLSFPGGVTASYNSILNGDIRQSLRAGHRTGTVLGLWITGTGLAAFCAMFIVMKTQTVINYSPYFALGAAVAAMIIHTGGEVYTSAYSLAVPLKDFTDRSGSFSGACSDFAGSYILAAACAVILAEVGVDTSGVTSTFTLGTAALYPVLVYAAGIAGSIISAFLYRAGIGNDFSKGNGLACIAAGAITGGASVYLSASMLQSRVYAWSVISGIAAGLVITALSRVFSSDSKFFINGYKTDRNLGKNSSVMFNFGTGMISTVLFTAVVTSAMAVSYMFARYYGIALCAVGMISILSSLAAITGIVSVSGTTSDILSAQDHGEYSEAVSASVSLLDSAAARNLVSVKAYADIAGMMSAIAAYCALFYSSGINSVDLMTLRVFAGVIIGVASAFLLSGMIIGSVQITGRVALRDIGKNDDDTGATSALRGAVLPSVIAIALPTVIGLLIGVKALAGFNIAAIVTGFMLITSADNAGMHFENSALQSLSSLLKMMVVFSVAFLPVFMEFGGFLFG